MLEKRLKFVKENLLFLKKKKISHDKGIKFSFNVNLELCAIRLVGFFAEKDLIRNNIMKRKGKKKK